MPGDGDGLASLYAFPGAVLLDSPKELLHSDFIVNAQHKVMRRMARTAAHRRTPRLWNCCLLLAVCCAFLLSACSSSTPLDRLKSQLASAPEYAIILSDMREEGTFFSSYFHQYQVVQGENSWTTDWLQVPESVYRANENFLGMTLASKTPDGENNVPHPPGYDYVGNPRYGSWQTNSSGMSFWAFYGQYALMRDLLGIGRGSIFRNDYDSYQRSRSERRPYYGRTGREYGTRGTVTQQQKPSFFARRRARDAAQRQRFQQKFNNRFGRSSVPVRSRGFGFGK